MMCLLFKQNSNAALSHEHFLHFKQNFWLNFWPLIGILKNTIAAMCHKKEHCVGHSPRSPPIHRHLTSFPLRIFTKPFHPHLSYNGALCHGTQLLYVTALWHVFIQQLSTKYFSLSYFLIQRRQCFKNNLQDFS